SEEIVIPVTIAYGIVVGAGLSFVYPLLGTFRPLGEQIKRALLSCAILVAATAAQVFLLYGDNAARMLPARVAFVILFAFGLALTFSKRERRSHQ
ncbi:MAG: hypothetical protein MUO76_00525, partial [Anaerolineaceae bacterium]|nr:hypothetical protein [Anaerolineaceae bacterium]